MDALALAERLDLHELASEAITTLSGLKKAGPKEGLRAALVDAVARAEESDALHAELRGRFLLGRSFEDWAEFDESETWFRSAIDRAIGAGVPWAPYAFESRVQLTWIKVVRGDWDEVLALTDLSHESAPPIPQGDRRRAADDRRSRRAAPTSAPRPASCAASGRARAPWRSTPRRSRWCRPAAPATRPAPSRSTTTWSACSAGPGTSGSVRGSGSAPPPSARSRTPCRPSPRPSGRRTPPGSTGSTPTGTSCSTATPTRPATGVPRVGPG